MPAVCEYTVVTKLNEYAISAAGVGEAMQRSAAALAAANNSFEQSIGMIVAANTTAQNPEKVGTTLKTVSMFLRAAKVDAEEAGESTEGMASSVSKLRQEVLTLTKGAVDVMANPTTLKSTYEIFDELSKVWDQMADIDQAALLEKIGGKRNANITAAIIQNWDLAKKSMQGAVDSEGTAVRENEKYLDSIEGRIAKFKVSFEELAQTFVSSKFLKGIVSFGSGLMRAFNFLSKTFAGGGTLGKIFSVGGLAMLFNLDPLARSFEKIGLKAKNFMSIFTGGDLTPGVSGGIARGFSSVVNGFREIRKQMSTLEGGFFNRFATAANSVFGPGGAIAVGVTAAVSSIALIAATIGTVKTIVDQVRQKQIDAANEVINKNKESEESYNNNVKSLTEIRDKYNELSQGVDIDTNKNISLAADDYQEYLNIVNQIAEISPDLVSGYDSEGNAIIKYSNAINEAIKSQKQLADLQKQDYLSSESGETLYKGKGREYKSALKELDSDARNLELAMRAAAYQESGGDPGKVFKNVIKALNDIGVELDGNKVDAENMWNAFHDEDALQKIYSNKNALLNALNISDVSEKGVDDVKKAMTNMSDAIMDITDINSAEVDYLMDQAQEQSWFNNLPTEAVDSFRNKLMDLNDPTKSFAENMENAESLGKEISEVFGGDLVSGMDELESKMRSGEISVKDYMDGVLSLSDKMKDAGISDEVNNFVTKYYESLTAGMSSATDKVVQKLSDVTTEKNIDLSKILGGDGAAKNFTKDVDSYLNDINLLQNALTDLRLGDDSSENVEKARERFKDLDMTVGGVQGKIGELNTGMRLRFGEEIAKQSGEGKQALIDLETEILNAGNMLTSFSVDIDINAETEGLGGLQTALTEATSSTGLSTASIDALRNRYGEVISYLNNTGKKVDFNKLLESTANGIQLNDRYLSGLESTYRTLKMNEINSGLNAMSLEYDSLANALAACEDKNSSYAKSLKDQMESIESSMANAQIIKSQFEGLTSSFHEWEMATSSADSGAMYDSLASGIEGIKELYDKGRVGIDDFASAVRLMTNEDLTEANYDSHEEYINRLKEIYEDGIGKMSKYFTSEDARVGLANFLGDLSEITDGVEELDNGDYKVHLNVDDAAKFAEELGLSTQEVEILMGKLREYGYDVNFDSVYDSLEQLKGRSEEAISSLKEQGVIDVDYEFNFRSTDTTELQSQIDYLKKKKEELYDDDGKVKVGVDQNSVNQVNTMLAALIRQKAAASTPALLSIVTSGEGAAANAISLLQDLAGFVATAQVEIETNGEVSSETQGEIEKTIGKLNEVPEEVSTELKIDTKGFDASDIDGMSKKLAEMDKDIEVNVKAKIDKIDGLDTVDGDKTVNVNINFDPSKVDKWKPKDRTLNVKTNFNHSAVDRWTPPTKHGTVYYTAVGLGGAAGTAAPPKYKYTRKSSDAGQIKTGGRRSVRGLTQLTGSAFKSGSWGTKSGGVALMGELGPELVVF